MGSNDSITETTSQSWFSRLGQSIKSVGIGIILFFAAFPVLWCNESNAVRVATGLSEGSGAVISLAEAKVDATKDGKLVHLTGEATTTDTVNDPVLGISEQAIRIVREVQMYQWQEQSSSKTEKKLGGGTETKTTYTYSKGWSSSVINSSSFKQPYGHDNPGAMEIQNDSFNASNVTVGDFTLPSGLISQITQGEKYQFTQDKLAQLPGNLQGRARLSGSEIYVGEPSNPQVGDLKIGVTIVKPQKVSIVAQQQGNTFTSYRTKQDTTIMMLSSGAVSATEMFAQAQASNRMWTWIKRLIGFIMFYIAITMIFKPIVTFGDVIPFVGSILNFGIGIFAFVVALALSLITIALAWIAARPVIGIGLLVVGVGAVVLFKMYGKKKQAPQPAAT